MNDYLRHTLKRIARLAVEDGVDIMELDRELGCWLLYYRNISPQYRERSPWATLAEGKSVRRIRQ